VGQGEGGNVHFLGRFTASLTDGRLALDTTRRWLRSRRRRSRAAALNRVLPSNSASAIAAAARKNQTGFPLPIMCKASSMLESLLPIFPPDDKRLVKKGGHGEAPFVQMAACNFWCSAG
jgi:hypothetical protein